MVQGEICSHSWCPSRSTRGVNIGMLVRLWSIGTLAGRSGILWSWFFKNLKDVSDLKRSCVRLTLLSGKTLRRGIKEIAEIKSQSYNGPPRFSWLY